MKRNTLAPLVLLLVVVLLSGCTAAEKKRGVATGVIIKEFRAEGMSEVYSGDSVIFTLTVENIGGADADSVIAKIFGLGTDWKAEDPDTGQRDLGTLAKSEAEYDIPGGLVETTFQVKSPSGLAVDSTYEAGMRISYNYDTTAHGTLKIYDYDYLKSVPDEAETIMKSSALDSFSVTKAPITVSLAGAARPLIYRSGGTNKGYITVQLSNVGQGYSYSSTVGDRKVTITSAKINNKDCEGHPTTVVIPREGSTSFACKFDIPTVVQFQTIPIDIQLDYKYFVDDSAEIKVLKTFT